MLSGGVESAILQPALIDSDSSSLAHIRTDPI